MPLTKEPIFTKGFCILCFVNVTFFISLNMMLPVMPLYLLDELKAGKSVTGILLSAYVLAALCIRPVAGYIVDNYARKPVFLLCALAYTLSFSGYLVVESILLLALLRMAHGTAFGLVNTSTSTLLVDIIPPLRLGTGIGFFGVTSAITMAVGPMLGLLLYDYFSAQAVFRTALGIALAGCLAAFAAPAGANPPARAKGAGASGVKALLRTVKNANPEAGTSCASEASSSTGAEASGTAAVPEARFMDKIFLSIAGREGVSVACSAFMYGLLLNFVSVFAKERGIEISVGYFFALLALGTMISRTFAGRFIDGGSLSAIVVSAQATLLASAALLLAAPSEFWFFISAIGFGLGVGILFPAYQTMFIDLAPPSRRGIANSSFFISWDGGIGLSLFAGGVIADLVGFDVMYAIGGGVIVLSLIFYLVVVAPHYARFSLRGKRSRSGGEGDAQTAPAHE